jgi:predicted component of type VI protein secretion system
MIVICFRPIKYKSMKAQHQQVGVDRSQTLTEFIKEDEINLPPGELYDLTDIAYVHRCKFCPLQQ